MSFNCQPLCVDEDEVVMSAANAQTLFEATEHCRVWQHGARYRLVQKKIAFGHTALPTAVRAFSAKLLALLSIILHKPLIAFRLQVSASCNCLVNQLPAFSSQFVLFTSQCCVSVPAKSDLIDSVNAWLITVKVTHW